MADYGKQRKYKSSNIVTPVKSDEVTEARRSMLSDEHNWSKTGKFRKYFMPRQHVAFLKSQYAIPPFKIKNIE